MRRLIKVLLLVPLTCLVAVPAFADHGHSRLESRLERQQERIDAGVESGALTYKEARVLKRDQQRLRRLARKMLKDGEISKREGRKLAHKLDQVSDRIREYKHNDNYRAAGSERCFYSRDSWHGAGDHHWSYQLNLAPRYSYR